MDGSRSARAPAARVKSPHRFKRLLTETPWFLAKPEKLGNIRPSENLSSHLSPLRKASVDQTDAFSFARRSPWISGNETGRTHPRLRIDHRRSRPSIVLRFAPGLALPTVIIPPFPYRTDFMPSPTDCRYSDSHEWFRLDGDVVTMGITQFAADQLTDVTYVAMKPAGTRVGEGESVGEVESVKTTGDVYSAITGEIIEVNSAVSADPSLVNSDPYGAGWMVRLRVDDPAPLSALKDGSAYDQSLAGA